MSPVFLARPGLKLHGLRTLDEGVQCQCVKTDLDTLATARYARIDDELKASPRLAPWRPAVGIVPTLSDAEVVANSSNDH